MKKEQLHFKVHLAGFLQEIFNNDSAGTLKQGAIQLRLILDQVDVVLN